MYIAHHEHLHTLPSAQVSLPQTEVLIAYKQRIKSDEAFFEAAARHFEISTVWRQQDSHQSGYNSQHISQVRKATLANCGKGWVADACSAPGSGSDSDKALQESGSTGDWVRDSACCVLRLIRRRHEA
jgi:hypothetical protein